ncbi:hypothetical protein FRB93_004294 [Tulasnella sp. JGI-2019a]|nr:hypothetical protein FRB93_004294 [Tulasnella sp. JGI-2019a]
MVEAGRLFIALSGADKYETLLSHVGPDPKDLSLFLPNVIPRLPALIRNSIALCLRVFFKDSVFSRLFVNIHGRTVKDYWAETVSRDKYRRLFYNQVWEAHGFDGLICPVNALPVIGHGTTKDLSVLGFATGVYNVVDHPVGIVPVTRVDKAKDTLSDTWRESGVKGSSLMYGKIYEQREPLYDATKMHGIPVAVQVVGRSWEDEKVIEMMKVVDAALGDRDFGPGAWGRKHSC